MPAFAKSPILELRAVSSLAAGLGEDRAGYETYSSQFDVEGRQRPISRAQSARLTVVTDDLRALRTSV